MAQSLKIEVNGLKELLRDARKVEKDLPKEMRTALLPVSREVLSRGRPGPSHWAASTPTRCGMGLRAGATQNTAWIKLLGSQEPTIFGAEFGGGAPPNDPPVPALARLRRRRRLLRVPHHPRLVSDRHGPRREAPSTI